LNAVERLTHYCFKIPQEDQSGKEVAMDWPTNGIIDINNLDLSYSSKPNQLVIKNPPFVSKKEKMLPLLVELVVESLP
jgi:hypothetical protein